MNTGSIKTTYRSLFISIIFLIPGIVLSLSGCGKTAPVVSRTSVQEEHDDEEELTQGNVILSEAQLASYGSITDCAFQDDREIVSLKLNMPDIPKSDDYKIYLFAFEIYEECVFTDDFNKKPVTTTKKSTRSEFKWTYEKDFPAVRACLIVGRKICPTCSGHVYQQSGDVSRYFDSSGRAGVQERASVRPADA